MEKEWKYLITDCCPNCGDDLMVYSDCLESEDTEFEQVLTDCDEVKCIGCKFKTVISVDNESGEAWLQDGNIEELG